MNSIHCPLDAQAHAGGDRTAIITPDDRLSYRALHAHVCATADALGTAGIKPKDRVGIVMDNSLTYIILLHALFRRKAVAAPLSTRMSSNQLARRLHQIGGDLLITDSDSIHEEVDDLTILNIRNLEAPDPQPTDESASIDLTSPATIVFTSGSSGQPKPALHSYGNHFYSALGSNENISVSPGDRWLLSLPLYHVGGLAILFRCLTAGAAVVISEADTGLPGAMRSFNITHMSLVATQMRRLLDEGSSVPEHIQAILLGGSGIPDTLIDEAVHRDLPIYVSYGLTEMSSQVTTTPPGATRKHLHTSGRLLPYRKLETADDGEILVRGQTLFQGYVDGDSLTPHRDERGWYHTGDIGEVDQHGYLHVVGRKDNMFISGGENIHPEEIESVLEQLPEIEEAIVVPVADEEFGYRPVAFIRWQDSHQPLGKLREQLATSLERFKLPVAILDWPDDQPSTGMKVDRNRLRILAEEQIE